MISQRRTSFGYKKSARIRAFHLQQPDFFVNASGIARQAAAYAHDPVARDDEGDGIVPHCAAHGLRRHPGKIHPPCHALGDLP